jgi:hypothetical protein
MTIINKRSNTDYPLNSILQNRWSPRALDETATVSHDDLLALLEAGRWAPSAFNNQPWRYYIGQRGDVVFHKILSCLGEFNQAWAKRSALLILGTATKEMEDGKPHPSYQFDLGLSVSQLTFEAMHRGYVTHQMSGFDKDLARSEFTLTNFEPIIVIAIGKQGEVEVLPEPVQDREKTFSTRKPLNEIVIQGLPN